MAENAPNFAELRGVEWLAARVLYSLRYLQLSKWLDASLSRWFKQERTIDCYVATCVAITLVNWFWGPWLWLSIICSYLSISTVIALS